MATTMRAKMMVQKVVREEHPHGEYEKLHFCAVAKNGAYPSDGLDENNTFAKFSPSASLEIQVTNPALAGKIKAGEFYYVDFTPVEG